MPRILVAALLAAAPFFAATIAVAQAPQHKSGVAKGDAQVQRGRYLVKIAGCNDCHTPGYAMSGGKVPEAQ